MKVPMRKPQTTDLVERTGPEIFRFESPGDCLRGQLLNIETTEIGGKPTLKYIVRDEMNEETLQFSRNRGPELEDSAFGSRDGH